MEAYEAGKIRGKKLAQVRRILDQRLKRKGIPTVASVEATAAGGLPQRSASHLSARGGKAADSGQESDFTQAKLLFIVEALKELLADEGFSTLLRAEGLATMPRALARV